MALRHFSYELTKPPRWDLFALGLVIDLMGLVMMIAILPHLTSPIMIDPVDTRQSVTLIAPRLTPVAPAQEPPHVTPPRPQVLAKLAPPQPIPRTKIPEVPKVEPPKVTPEIASQPSATPAAPAPPPRPAPPVTPKINVFGAAGSATATVHRPPGQVQTGGFGDPNGIHGTGDPRRETLTVAKVGSFDLPQGPGQGNGTGGAHGVSGTIRSAGFADGVASPGPHGPNKGGVVASAGFGDAVVASKGGPSAHPDKPSGLQPVEILYKPRPTYTSEARRAGVEGEVLLDVVFEASGALRINRVVKGLGYGLDENAIAAARRIRFRPARRDGQPRDFAALVHIVFELAN